MVQLLADPTISLGAAVLALDRPDIPHDAARILSREEHAQKLRDLSAKAAVIRAPRRGWSLSDHQASQDGAAAALHLYAAVVSQPDLQHMMIPEHAVLLPPARPVHAAVAVALPARRATPPRRSQSVTDKEPEFVGQSASSPSSLGSRLTLLDLPSELHYNILDFLDPLDSVCFGLAHSRLYAIHRRKNGIVPLSSRYSGPNDREWAWRGSGTVLHSSNKKDERQQQQQSLDLHNLRVKGQIYCRKCGTSRCELHRHLREWFGRGREYCEVKEMYGPPAGAHAKSYCYMPSPKNPHRCGRHGAKRVLLR